MNKKDARENYLLNILKASPRITTSEAVKMLDVSEATARRVFSDLEKSGKVIRNYGGIQLSQNNQSYSFEASEKMYMLEKKRIGTMAASLVDDDDTIYLDCGTTSFQMMLALSERIASGDLHSINVITNSIVNVQVTVSSPQCRVILIGGEYNSKRRDFSGLLTKRYVEQFHFTKCFLGCDGITIDMGICSNNIDISSLNSTVIEHSDFSYVLLDNSKFGKCSLVTYAQLNEINAIITDIMPNDRFQDACQAAGLELWVAP